MEIANSFHALRIDTLQTLWSRKMLGRKFLFLIELIVFFFSVVEIDIVPQHCIKRCASFLALENS